MSDNSVAFFIGLFGSIHCVGMCGPLAFAIPLKSNGFWLLVIDKLIYNLGRIVSYSTLGLIAGLIGKQLWLAGLQQGLSLFSGVLIMLAAASRLLKIKAIKNNISLKLLNPFNRLLTYALQRKAGHFLIGLLNGLLPCGFVYLALVGAVNTEAPALAAQFMFLFGVGTMPLMLIAMISAGMINKALRIKLNLVAPYFMLLLGIWFVLRGLALNIPYLSPPPVSSTSICR